MLFLPYALKIDDELSAHSLTTRPGEEDRSSNFIAELSRAKRAQRSTLGKELWKTTHPRKFGNHVTVHRPPDRPTVRPHHRHTNVK